MPIPSGAPVFTRQPLATYVLPCTVLFRHGAFASGPDTIISSSVLPPCRLSTVEAAARTPPLEPSTALRAIAARPVELPRTISGLALTTASLLKSAEVIPGARVRGRFVSNSSKLTSLGIMTLAPADCHVPWRKAFHRSKSCVKLNHPRSSDPILQRRDRPVSVRCASRSRLLHIASRIPILKVPLFYY